MTSKWGLINLNRELVNANCTIHSDAHKFLSYCKIDDSFHNMKTCRCKMIIILALSLQNDTNNLFFLLVVFDAGPAAY